MVKVIARRKSNSRPRGTFFTLLFCFIWVLLCFSSIPVLAAGGGGVGCSYTDREITEWLGHHLRMIIITTEEMAPHFEYYAREKTKYGVPTAVFTLNYITSVMPCGPDVQHTLREFIKKMYEDWAIEYVLLGGGVECIPTRFVQDPVYPFAQHIPTDLYYAGLDGSWNSNGNEVYGEATSGAGLPDSLDLSMEVAIGRIPASTAEDASEIVDKLLNYLHGGPQFTYSKAAIAAEVILPTDYVLSDPDSSITLNGADIAEGFISILESSGHTPIRYYETDWLYGESSALSVDAVLSALNEGVSILLHVGHGSP